MKILAWTLVIAVMLCLLGILQVNVSVSFDTIADALSTDVELYDDCVDRGFEPDFCEESLMTDGAIPMHPRGGKS
jgi:hypothetical protein